MTKTRTGIRSGKGRWGVSLQQKQWLPYAMIAPGLVLVALIAVYPALSALRISTYEMNLLRMFESKFVGLINYEMLLQDDRFLGSVLRTLRWTGVVVAFQMALGLPLALFLNVKFPWRGFARTLVLIPWVVPPTVTAVIWAYMFDANFGVLNEILVRLHILQSYFAWLSDNTGSFAVVASAMVWTGTPLMAIMLLAALQALPEDIYEAARIDGAGAWQRFRYITLPQLMPTILLLLLLRSMWLSHHVDIIYLITDGGPGVANLTLSVFTFRLGAISLNVGYASAVAVVLALILLIAAVIYIHYIERSRDYLQ